MMFSRGPLRFRSSIFVRQVSVPAAPAYFTSYFWRNDRWAPTKAHRLSRTTPGTRAQTLGLTCDLVQSPNPHRLTSPSSHASVLVPYKLAPASTFPRLLSIYANLSKSRLSILIVLTAMSSVALSPLPTSLPVLLATAFGTALCSASANTLNQLQEVPYDAQMARTRGRPIVRHLISPSHAVGFALVTGVAGPSILWAYVNSATALLGLANTALYAGAYTYLKRRSVFNTWVGAVVGAIPPLMGWTACGGPLIPSSDHPVHFFLPPFLLDASSSQLPVVLANNPLSALALFLFLYSWQFPHFNPLSYLVRASYAQAGYHMLSVLSPPKNAVVALRHAIFLIPVCSILFPLSGLTNWGFALTSLVPNMILVRHAWGFFLVNGNGEKEARKVWNTSLWYLPVVMGLMMLHKNGLGWKDWFTSTAEDGEHRSGEDNGLNDCV